MTVRNWTIRLNPATLVMVSFLMAIAAGTVALKIPIATVTCHLAWTDALFTATSAVCVTGLTVVDTGTSFTLFGQNVILILIQIGGIGVMTISVVLFQWIGKSLSFKQRMAIQGTFSHTPRKDIFHLIKSIFLFTLAAETIGAVLLTLFWIQDFSLPRAFYNGVFHSVSAFCNAGFALFPNSLSNYSGNVLLNAVICGLIVIGGIGFPVLYELQSWLKHPKSHKRLSVQTKTVLLTTLVLILLGAVLLWFLERQELNRSPFFSHQILAPIFQSITCRTAGFNTMDITALNDAALTLMIFLMFFGASPGSCGGGVKTTTLVLMIALVKSKITRKKRVNLFKKSIPDETVSKSVSLMLVSVGIITMVLFLLLAGDSATVQDAAGLKGRFLAYLFETVSAFGTVGLSMGITPVLSTWDKYWIILTMIIGRVGVLTFSYVITGSGPGNGIIYSEENIMIG